MRCRSTNPATAESAFVTLYRVAISDSDAFLDAACQNSTILQPDVREDLKGAGKSHLLFSNGGFSGLVPEGSPLGDDELHLIVDNDGVVPDEPPLRLVVDVALQKAAVPVHVQGKGILQAERFSMAVLADDT